MKTLKMFVLVATIAFSSAVSAGTNPIEEAEPRSIIETVGELLKNPDFQLQKDVNAIVDLIVNDNNEIVVVSVKTHDKKVEKYIKNRLNYKKLSNETLGDQKSFKIPVRMVELN